MKFERNFVIVSVAVLGLFVFFLYEIYGSIKERTIRDLNAEQQVHAQQAAIGIENYVNNLRGTLNLLGQFPDIIAMNAAGKRMMKDCLQFSPDEMKSVTRVDARGTISYTVPDTGSAGRDISQQEHIRLIMKTHTMVVSDVFKSVQGDWVIAIHVPVFRNGVYDGTLAFLLSFDKLAQRYLRRIQVGEHGYAWVVSKKGMEIFSPNTDQIGRNAYDVYRSFPEIQSLLDSMLQRKQGVATYHYLRQGGQAGETVLKHAVYMPISLGNTFWSIVVATPEDELIASLAGVKSQFLVVTFALLTIYIVCLYLIVRFQIVIAEQKKRDVVGAALQLSDERLRMIMDVTRTAVWDWDLKLDRWYASPFFYSMLGLAAADGVTDRTVWLQRLHPDDRASVIAKTEAVLAGTASTYSYEARMQHADGTYRWHSVVGSVVEKDQQENRSAWSAHA